MKKIFLILALLCTMVQGAWAQNGIYCTASDKNRVVCTDGTIYDNVAAATADGKTAAAKIIYIDEVNKKGLALALKDEAINTQDGGITACNNKNTSMPVVGGTWKLASKSEWDSMINAAGGSPTLHNGFSSVGGTNMVVDPYWSSEKDGSNGFVLQYSMGWFGPVSNSGWANIRACLTFNLLTLYEIGSQSEWDEFCTAVYIGSTLFGDTFSDKYVKLTSDIIVSEMAGSSESNSFQGLFDGGGHTLTVSYNTEDAVTAPFRYVKNATIRNLKTTGTITTSAMCAAGIVGDVAGSLKLSSCNSSVSISSSRPQMDAHGGLVASNNGNVTISGCVFDGSFAATVAHNNLYGTTFCGGIVGMCVENTSTTITNSLVAPSSVAEGMVSKTFVGLDDNATVTIENCYFVATANLPTNQGTQVYYTAPANEISKPITISGTTVYSDACSVSGVEATYNLDSGLASVTPTLTDPFAATLTFGTDYTATLNGNAVQNLPVKISTAGGYTLVLTGTGDYTGSTTFNITATGDVVNSALAIGSEAEWDTFAESVNNGTNYSDQFVKLNSDISVSTMVGSSETNSFQGTFLGGGHTITAAITDNINGGAAPFRYIKNATIKNLTVAGTITSNQRHMSGLVGIADSEGEGKNLIEGCTVTATLNINTDYAGGIIGHGKSSATTIRGCVFAGTMNSNSNPNVGVIWGWSDSATPTLENSLEAGTYTGISKLHPMGLQKAAGTITNCYYTTPQIGSPENACTVSGARLAYTFATAIANLGDLVQDYGFAKVYQNGIFYDGTYYAIPAPLAGSGTEDEPYIINNDYDWNSFAYHVNNGSNYSDQFVKLNSDISVSEMVGSSETNSFQGTFLGDGVHTLNFTAGSSSAAFGEENCAPFRYTKNATIRDLKVTGTIYTSRKFAAGLVARNSGETNITNCQVGTVIHSSVSGDGTHGGIVAMPASNTTTSIAGCVYNGRLLTTSSTQYCGGFVGWSGDNTVTVAHSLYAPDANIVVAAGETAINHGATFVRGNTPTVETSCYYTETMGSAQGTRAIGTATAPANLGNLVQDYGMVKAYQNGILYNGKYYVAPASISLADNADNSTTISEANGYVADVTLTGRTLYRDGAWNTLCLPFSVDNFIGTPLGGATVKTLTESFFDSATGTLTLTFSDDLSATEAGKPYIVKWATPGDDIVNPVFPAVSVSTSVNNATTTCATFMGSYDQVTLTGGDSSVLYLGGNNNLYFPAADRKIGAFRAYFKLNLKDPGEVKAFVLDFNEDNATSLNEELRMKDEESAAAQEWYDLSGRKMQNGKLSKGIYIQNGRKILF